MRCQPINPRPALRKLNKSYTASVNSPNARVLSFFDMFHMKPVSIGCPKMYALGSVRGFWAIQSYGNCRVTRRQRLEQVRGDLYCALTKTSLLPHQQS